MLRKPQRLGRKAKAKEGANKPIRSLAAPSTSSADLANSMRGGRIAGDSGTPVGLAAQTSGAEHRSLSERFLRRGAAPWETDTAVVSQEAPVTVMILRRGGWKSGNTHHLRGATQEAHDREFLGHQTVANLERGDWT
jgi:hypothetical protein